MRSNRSRGRDILWRVSKLISRSINQMPDIKGVAHPLQDPDNLLRKDTDDLFRQRQSDHHDRQKDTPHRPKEHHIGQSQDPHRPILGLLHHFRQTEQESQQPEDPFEQSGEHDGADNRDVDDVFDGPCWWVHERSVEEGGRHGEEGEVFEG